MADEATYLMAIFSAIALAVLYAGLLAFDEKVVGTGLGFFIAFFVLTIVLKEDREEECYDGDY